MQNIDLLKDLSRSYRKQMKVEADRERLFKISQQSAEARAYSPILWLYLAELLIAVSAVIIFRL